MCTVKVSSARLKEKCARFKEKCVRCWNYLGIGFAKLEHQNVWWWISEMTGLKTSFANAKKNY